MSCSGVRAEVERENRANVLVKVSNGNCDAKQIAD